MAYLIISLVFDLSSIQCVFGFWIIRRRSQMKKEEHFMYSTDNYWICENDKVITMRPCICLFFTLRIALQPQVDKRLCHSTSISQVDKWKFEERENEEQKTNSKSI